MALLAVKIAVSAASYSFDRPYEYLVPESLSGAAVPGVRVFVPFGAGNRRAEGIILSVTSSPAMEFKKLKPILKVLDEQPVVSRMRLNLAMFMRERFFCTVYSAVRAMLPAGLYIKDDGKTKVSDKTVEIVRLLVSGEEALQYADSLPKSSHARASVLRELAPYGEMTVRDLLVFAGTTRAPLKYLTDQNLIGLYSREVFRLPGYKHGEASEMPVLSEEQSEVYEGLSRLASAGTYSSALLQGITGSGKTSVYIRLIGDVLKMGKTAILLVPEIALTPQMLSTFSSYFGDDIAVLHSSLSAGERYDEWKRLKSGRAHLAIGTRSAIFAPVEDVGIIIIDEEQEESYRSENSPRYDARDIARYLAYSSRCLLLLGSATPDICSRYLAETGKASFFRLDTRYNRQSLPNVIIADMKNELRSGSESTIGSLLFEELRKNIESGEQSILFLNRRGARKLIKCPECDYEFTCPNCSVPLTYHSVENRLVCHYCGFSQKVPVKCPECSGTLKYIGIGTQLVESDVRRLFPDIQVIRMDTDVLSPSVTHEQIFEKFRRENIPVMIGTQMVTKGLNFENVTLVGVILAEQGLSFGSIRSGERTFSLITQVVGRSGRGIKPGRAVIQTYSPSNEVIQLAAEQNYDGFYESEIMLRKMQDAPPFSDIVTFSVFGRNEDSVTSECRHIRERFISLIKGYKNMTVMGPTAYPVLKVNNIYRYRVIVKIKADDTVRSAISKILNDCFSEPAFRFNTLFADINPEI